MVVAILQLRDSLYDLLCGGRREESLSRLCVSSTRRLLYQGRESNPGINLVVPKYPFHWYRESLIRGFPTRSYANDVPRLRLRHLLQ
jgi:hypothetical protein